MNYPKLYLEYISSGKEIVSAKVRKVYERECHFMEKPPADFQYVFDEKRGEHHIRFIETFCRHSKGRLLGKPIRLELFQKAKIQLVFGWVHKETRLRRFREVVDVRGRKCGKSTETAAVELDVLVNDKEGGAEIYNTANKREQADIIQTEVNNMRLQSQTLNAVLKKRAKDIYFPSTFGYIRSLTADTNTLDGLNAHFFCFDEWHEAKNSALYDVMVQSQSAREQPLAWLISTNGFVREGFFDSKYDAAEKVALWGEGFRDYTLLPLLYELDSRKEWENPDCWAKANPGLGSIKSLDTLRANVTKAKRTPDFLPTLLTKDFNIPENHAAAWLSYDELFNTTIIDIERMRGSLAVGGCDLSATTDLTCATLLIQKPNDNNIYVLQMYFLPESRVKVVSEQNKTEAPYEKWAHQGYLTVCPGSRVDYREVTKWFVKMHQQYNIGIPWVGYDAALSGYWVPEMIEYGFEMQKIRQGVFTWTYPMKQLKGLFQEKRIIYDNNPILRWCLHNTGVKSTNRDGIESIQPVKTSSTKRIDGMVSLLNAYTCFNNNIEEYQKFIR